MEESKNIEISEEEKIKKHFSIERDNKKKHILIPLSFSVMFKKVTWSETNKSVKVMMTCISRVSTHGLGDHFDMNDAEVKLLIQDIEEVNFRVNDELIKDDEQLARDAFGDLKLKKEKKVSDDKPLPIGMSQVSRLTLDNVLLDMSSSNQSRFPIDQAIISLAFDFYPIKKLMVKEEGSEKLKPFDKENGNSSNSTEYWEFRYKLLDSVQISDMISMKLDTIDNLETHNFYKNYDGLNYLIEGINKVTYQIRIIRNPQDTIKTAIAPLLVLMLISLATTSFGAPADQLANLLAVYLAYGQFILVFNEKTLDQKIISIADYINLFGMFINIIQFVTIIILAYFGLTNDNGETCEIKFNTDVGRSCDILYTTNAVVIGLFFGTLVYAISWYSIYECVLKSLLEKPEPIMDSKNRGKSETGEKGEKADGPKDLTIRNWVLWDEKNQAQKPKGQNFIWSLKEEKDKEKDKEDTKLKQKSQKTDQSTTQKMGDDLSQSQIGSTKLGDEETSLASLAKFFEPNDSELGMFIYLPRILGTSTAVMFSIILLVIPR